MKSGFVYLASAALFLSSCGTYTGTGAFTGGSIGSVLGSAIGGLAGGPRGSDLGTIVGMAGGAAVGAVIGSKADQNETQRVRDHYEEMRDRGAYSKSTMPSDTDDTYRFESSAPDNVEYDATNSGDDRLYDFQGSDYTGDYSAAQPKSVVPAQSSVEDITSGMTYTPNIVIENARFVDDHEDGYLSRGEMGKIIFEIRNNGDRDVYDVVPSVIETNKNRHIYISPSIHVESIAPGRAIRYTAIVKADNRLKDGRANFALAVLQGKKSISKVTEFNVRTRK